MTTMNLIPAYPEIFLSIAISVILLIDMFLPAEKRDVTYALSLVALAGCAVMSFFSMMMSRSALASVKIWRACSP